MLSDYEARVSAFNTGMPNNSVPAMWDQSNKWESNEYVHQETIHVAASQGNNNVATAQGRIEGNGSS